MTSHTYEWFHGRNTVQRNAFWIAVYDPASTTLYYQYGKGVYQRGRGRDASKKASLSDFRNLCDEKLAKGYTKLAGGTLQANIETTDPRSVIAAIIHQSSSSASTEPEPVPVDEEMEPMAKGSSRAATLGRPESRKAAIDRTVTTLDKAANSVTVAGNTALNMISVLPFSTEEELLPAYRTITDARARFAEALEEMDSYIEMFTDSIRIKIEEDA